MALKVRKISDFESLNAFLRGGLIGGNDLNKPVYGLDGLTLILTSPAATVTFDTDPEGAQQALSLSQIIDQIDAQAPGYAKAYKGRLKLEDPAGATAVVIGNGTANTILGFKNGQAGVVYAAPTNAAPALVDIEPLESSSFLVTTDDA